MDGSSTRFGPSAFNTVVINRIPSEFFRRTPSEEFGITVCSVGILTRTRTHLKLIWSCTIATGGSLTTSTLKLVGVTFFFSAFGRPPPPLLPLVQDPRPATPLVICKDKSTTFFADFASCNIIRPLSYKETVHMRLCGQEVADPPIPDIVLMTDGGRGLPKYG